MSQPAANRILMFVWFTVLASPIAWGTSLVAMLWLTHPVCQGMSRSYLTLLGVACALVALCGALAAGRALHRTPARVVEDSGDTLSFLLRLAMWSGWMFALVIGFSLVPTALLSPCPL